MVIAVAPLRRRAIRTFQIRAQEDGIMPVRALSRVFIHLDKRVKAVPRKSALEKLKKAGRVKEIVFTRNHSALEIERLLLANFPTLAGLDMSCLRIITSYDRGHSMKVVYKHVPSGNEIMEKFGGSNRKTVFLHWKPVQNSSVLTVAAHDAANAPTVGYPDSSFLATSATTTPSQVFSVTSTATTSSLHFTIQRRRWVVLHEHPITEGEVLDVYEREEENVKELLDSQVSFRGNVPQVKEDILSATVVDEVQKEKPRKERKIEKCASREITSEKRKASIRKKLKKLKKGKQRKREVAKKNITLKEDSKQEDKETKEIGKEKDTQGQEQENKEAKEKVEDGKEIGKEKEEKQSKGKDSKQENKEAKEKVEDEKEIGKETETQVQEEKEDKGEDKEQDTKNLRKRKKDKRTGSQRKKSKKE